jgi:hypothetical protein
MPNTLRPRDPSGQVGKVAMLPDRFHHVLWRVERAEIASFSGHGLAVAVMGGSAIGARPCAVIVIPRRHGSCRGR